MGQRLHTLEGERERPSLRKTSEALGADFIKQTSRHRFQDSFQQLIGPYSVLNTATHAHKSRQVAGTEIEASTAVVAQFPSKFVAACTNFEE